MTVRQLPTPKWTVPGASGAIASGWKVYTYEAGTTTAKDTYTTSAGTTANANPVVLDSRGEAEIWWDGTYKVVVKDSNDVTIWTVDNYGTGSVLSFTPQLSLVPNYSFEDATVAAGTPDNWTITLYTDGTQSLDTSSGNQIHGAQALKFTSIGTGGGYAESTLFEVQEGLLLAITVALKSSDAGVRNVVEIIWYDRTQATISTDSLYDDNSTNPTSWTDKRLIATPATNARYAQLRLTGCHSSDATTGSTWFDNVRSEPLRIARTEVSSSTGQTLNDDTVTLITTWDTEGRDDLGVHSTGTNPARFTIPANYSRCRIGCTFFYTANATGVRRAEVRKNGGAGTIVCATTVANAGATYATVATFSSRILDVVAGDYFELYALQNSSGTLLCGYGDSSYWIELYP